MRADLCGVLPKDAKTAAAFLCRWRHGRKSQEPTCRYCVAYVKGAYAPPSAPPGEEMTQEEMGRITFRIGPRDLHETKCDACGKLATYLLARPYDLAPGGEMASPSCAACAAGFPLWKEGGVGHAFAKTKTASAPGDGMPEVRAEDVAFMREDVELFTLRGDHGHECAKRILALLDWATRRQGGGP